MSSNFNLKRLPNNVILDSNILPQAKGLKSTFNLSKNHKTTIDFDYLYPVYWEELSPGDHFEMKVSTLSRLMPMVAPVMDNIKLKFMAFWVPNRLLWKHFLNFMGEKQWQDDKVEYLVPQINMKVKENVSGGLADYLGCPPTGTTCDYSVSALPFRAYNKIYNDWIRAVEIQEPLKEYSGDNLATDPAESKDTLASYKLMKKGKPLDYFTSCLPYPQAGEGVEIPLVGNSTVKARPNVCTSFMGVNLDNVYTRTSVSASIHPKPFGEDAVNLLGTSGELDPTVDTGLYADMSNVTGVSINSLRKAVALQELLERDARAGERYPELVRAHYGVTCPDFLLGRSQFIGSYTSDVMINAVAQNSSSNETTPQGNLVGVGIGQGYDNLCEISAVEHGIFMVLACATSDVSYQQGLNRKFSKLSRYDYFFPEFMHLGDQAVLNQEIFLSPDKATNEQVFGYTERYKEYRSAISDITGKLRSGVDGSLDVWHLAEKFGNLPKLNSQFLECNTPIDRVLAVQSEPDLILDLWFDVKATRGLTVSANPSILAGRV